MFSLQKSPIIHNIYPQNNQHFDVYWGHWLWFHLKKRHLFLFFISIISSPGLCDPEGGKGAWPLLLRSNHRLSHPQDLCWNPVMLRGRKWKLDWRFRLEKVFDNRIFKQLWNLSNFLVWNRREKFSLSSLGKQWGRGSIHVFTFLSSDFSINPSQVWELKYYNRKREGYQISGNV